MSIKQFENIMKNENSQQGFIDTIKIEAIIQKANELGITKMFYEHPGQATWRHRWENIPEQSIKAVAISK